MCHEGVDKVKNRIQQRLEWPGLNKACVKIGFLHVCHVSKRRTTRRLRFSLLTIESSEFNDALQNDHQKISMTATGYNQVLVMVDQIRSGSPLLDSISSDPFKIVWIARHLCPITFQSDKEKAFIGDLRMSLRRGRKWRKPTRPLITRRRMTWSRGKIAH